MNRGEEAAPVAARLALARWVALGLAAAILLAGVAVPVYMDEIGWRFHSRAWFDGHDSGMSVTCGAHGRAVPPLFMWPVRAFSAMAALAWQHPLSIRLAGLACLAAWLAILWRLVALASGDRRELAAPLRLLGFGLLAMGVLPLALAISRPEQPLLLSISLALLIALGARRGERRGRGLARLAAIVLLGAIAVSYHPKGAVYSPLFLLALAFRGDRRLLPFRLAAGAVLAIVMLLGYRFWSHRLSCPGDPVITEAMTRTSALADLLGGAPLIDALPALLRNLNPFVYIIRILPAPAHTSGWLPSGAIASAASPWSLIVFVAWSAALLAAPLLLLWLAISRRWSALGDLRVQFSALIVALALGWGAMQNDKSSYEAALVLPLIAIALILLLPLVDGPPGRRLWLVCVGSAALGAINLAALAVTYVPLMVRHSAVPGHPPGQSMSTGLFAYGPQLRQIDLAARQCGIPRDGSARGVLVDEATYFAFADTRELRFYLGLFDIWRGTLNDPLGYLASIGSSGLIVECSSLPTQLRPRARAVGRMCCMGPTELRAAAADKASRLPPVVLPTRPSE